MLQCNVSTRIKIFVKSLIDFFISYYLSPTKHKKLEANLVFCFQSILYLLHFITTAIFLFGNQSKSVVAISLISENNSEMLLFYFCYYNSMEDSILFPPPQEKLIEGI
jgi:hypothetical protein